MHKITSALLGVLLLLTGCASKSEQLIDQLEQEGYTAATGDTVTISEVSESYIKTVQNANPISGEFFCADPTAVEYNGRLYVYGTNDHQQYEAVGDDGKNTYDKIKSFVVFSTDDMINWTHHGVIDVEAVAPWIINSWAPSIVSRVEDDGLTHFYLYFSNNGCGVGVITATDPLGPWSDPLGKPLLNYDTEGLNGCPNPFDPGAVIDDNGVGWLSFGGGVAPDGTDYMPGVARIAQLGKDMVSFDSEFVEIKAPYFFEASELNYINGTYVYTYNNSWESRLEWNISGADRPSACSMSYMTTKTPLDSDSWQYKDHYFLNPGESGMDYCNNHSHLQKFGDKYYMLHHTMLKQAGMTTRGGFRSLSAVEAAVDEQNVVISRTRSDRNGINQIKYLDPHAVNEGETFFTTTGVDFEREGDIITAVKSTEAGSVVYIRQAYFDENALGIFTASVKGKGRIEFRLDSPTGACAAAIEFDNAEFGGVYDKPEQIPAGGHDIYIVFSDKDIALDCWQFR